MAAKEFKKKINRYIIEGNSYDVRHPSTKVIKELNKQQLECKEDEKVDLLVNFLEGQGLPADVGWELTPGQLGEIVEDISSGSKK